MVPGGIYETDIMFEDSILKQRKGYFQEVQAVCCDGGVCCDGVVCCDGSSSYLFVVVMVMSPCHV